eukprot:Em0001g2715a
MSLQWNAPLQPDYVITAYTLHLRVPSLKSQSEMWAPPSTATVQFHTYNPSGILFYQINNASNTFYVTVDMVHTAAITAAIVPLLTMKVYSSDGFDAVSVQNVGSTYIIVSWDLPTHSPPVTPAGTALQLEHGVGRHQCCSQPAQGPMCILLLQLSSLLVEHTAPNIHDSNKSLQIQMCSVAMYY